MRWLIAVLVLAFILIGLNSGCTREIIRETTIIRDSTPALEENLKDLKEKISTLEARIIEQEAQLKQQQGLAINSQIQYIDSASAGNQSAVLQEIPPAPLNITASGAIITPSTIIEETNKSEQIRLEINELLSKADSKVRSYSFIYTFSSTKLSGSLFYVRGNKVKIKLKDVGIYNFEDYFDTAYLNLTNKSAIGYCENAQLEACRKGANEYTLNFDDYRIKLPTDWLAEMGAARDSLHFLGRSILFERNAVLLENGNTLYWVDEFSGLPMRVQIRKDAFINVHDYRHLSINYLSEKDVTKA